MKKQQLTYWAIAVIIVVIGVVWFYKAKHAGQEKLPTSQPVVQNPTAATTAPASSSQADIWTGVLKNSDNSAKGSIMLVTKDRTIYIRTSRDFQSLVGKNVNVSYEGTWQSFALGDITLSENQ